MTADLERLVEMAPPGADPGRVDWFEVENRLGHGLPEDYKALIDTYGAGGFDDFVLMKAPGSHIPGTDLVAANGAEYMQDLEAIWDDLGERPEELAEEGSYLLAWANAEDGEELVWLVRPGQDPDDWTVMVLEEDLTEWEHYPMTCTGLLVGLISEEIVSSIVIPVHLGSETHAFRPYPALPEK